MDSTRQRRKEDEQQGGSDDLRSLAMIAILMVLFMATLLGGVWIVADQRDNEIDSIIAASKDTAGRPERASTAIEAALDEKKLHATIFPGHYTSTSSGLSRSLKQDLVLERDGSFRLGIRAERGSNKVEAQVSGLWWTRGATLRLMGTEGASGLLPANGRVRVLDAGQDRMTFSTDLMKTEWRWIPEKQQAVAVKDPSVDPADEELDAIQRALLLLAAFALILLAMSDGGKAERQRSRR